MKCYICDIPVSGVFLKSSARTLAYRWIKDRSLNWWLNLDFGTSSAQQDSWEKPSHWWEMEIP